MSYNSKDSENKVFTFKFNRQMTVPNLSPGIFSMMIVLSTLLVFMIIPGAFAQNGSKLTNNVVDDTLDNVDLGAQNVPNISATNETTADASNLGTNNRNLTLQSFSSFVDDVNSKLREESSSPITTSLSVSNTSSTNSSAASSTSSSSSPPSNQIANPSKILNLKEVIIQNTSMSIPAPVRHPGQPTHEVVFALPLRNDGYIWTGTVTFTASKPIEVEVLHTYAPLEKPDDTHGQPYHAVLPGNKSIAITHLRHLVDVPIEINGTGISSGTLDFAGNALVFHKTTGEPFTVTYTIDAVSKKLTQLDK